MRRYPLNYRAQFYNEGSFYALLPAARKPVVPGEKLSTIIFQARCLSAVFDKANLTPMLAQCWFFYVPNRLVWDQWVDFIALDDAVTTAPTAATAFPQLFEPQGAALVFPRRGLKMIYNQFFGEEAQVANGAWYTNVNDDTDVTLRRLLAWDQQRASTRITSGYVSGTYVAPVSGANATITLDDFQRSLQANYARRRQKMTGDKYVDTMRLFGVELDWRIQLAPEFLGSTQVVLQPREKASTQAVDGAAVNQLYKRAAEYAGELSFMLKQPKSFSEHGYILGFVGFRPAFMAAENTRDTVMTAPNDYYRPETGGVQETLSTRQTERYVRYLKGGNSIGLNQNGNVFNNATGPLYYPASTDYTVMVGSGPSHMSWNADVAFKGLTPVRPGVA